MSNSLIVETTAYLQLNCDGTWHTIGFGPNKKIIDIIDNKQTTISDWDKKREKLIRKGEIQPEAYPTTEDIEEFKPASYYLERANKIRQQRGGKEGHSKHCSRCGFTGKNRLTCMSVIDQNGVVVHKEHRKIGGEW